MSIIGEKVAQDNQIHVTRLDTPRNIYEASGHPLNIVGECEFYVKLSALGKVKRLNCLVLRGDRSGSRNFGKLFNAQEMGHDP